MVSWPPAVGQEDTRTSTSLRTGTSFDISGVFPMTSGIESAAIFQSAWTTKTSAGLWA